MYVDLYAAEWRTQARMEDALAEAEVARLVRQARRQERSPGTRQPWRSVLGRLASCLGYAPAPRRTFREYMITGCDLKL
jgi:hypothetical protein